MDKDLVVTVLGSAAVGALVSSIITELGKWRERKSRREELALAKAAEMAHDKVRIMMQVFKETNTGGKIAPDALILEDYFISLKHLLDNGELDPAMRARVSKEMAKYGVDMDNRSKV